MDDENSQGGKPPSAAGDPAGAATETKTTEQGLKFGDAETWRNAKELKDALASVREQDKKLKEREATLSKLVPLAEKLEQLGVAPQAQTPAPGPAADTSGLDARFSFREALLDFEVPKDKREIVERLWKAESPKNLSEWMPKTLESLGVKPGQAPAPVQQQPIAPSNSGAPIRPQEGATLPDNPLQWPKSYVDKMPFEQYHAEVQRYLRQHRGTPFRSFQEQRAKRLSEKKG